MKDTQNRSEIAGSKLCINMTNGMDQSSAAKPTSERRQIKVCSTKIEESKRLGKMFDREEIAHNINLKQLTCGGNYRKGLILSETFLVSNEDRQLCRCCETSTKQQKSTRVSKLSSKSISQPICNSRYRRTLNFRHRMPDWMMALTLLFIISVTFCGASPHKPRSSKRNAAILSIEATDDISTVNATRRANRKGRSSDFSKHDGLQKLYNNFYGYYLEVKRKVGGTNNEASLYSDIKIISMQTGYVALYFVESKKYLAMTNNKKGKLYAKRTYSDDCCRFKELLAHHDRYFTYEFSPKSRKPRKKHRYVALKKRRARKSSKLNKTTLFVKLASKKADGAKK